MATESGVDVELRVAASSRGPGGSACGDSVTVVTVASAASDPGAALP